MIVYVGGTFDLLHSGHLFLLRQARQLAGPGGRVVVALNTDAFVEAFKGHRPVQPYAERADLLAELRCVDRVVENTDGADSRPTLLAVRPDVIAVGWDYWSEDDSKYCRQMGFDRAWLAEHHISLAYMRWLPEHSSTRLRATARGMVA